LAKHIANSDPVEAAAALIKATGGIDAAVDLLIAAERSIASISKPVVAPVSEPVVAPVSEPVVEAEVEPGIATEEISPEDDSADWWKELMGEGTRPQEI
jgi:hypothetical protein